MWWDMAKVSNTPRVKELSGIILEMFDENKKMHLTYIDIMNETGCTHHEAKSATTHLFNAQLIVISKIARRIVFMRTAGACVGNRIVERPKKMRLCLMCRNMFSSSGPGNHICRMCRRNGALDNPLGPQWE